MVTEGKQNGQELHFYTQTFLKIPKITKTAWTKRRPGHHTLSLTNY